MKDEEYPHLPDGVEILANGDRVLIEVELTAKSRTRYLSKEREFGGGMNTHEGLIPEIQRRAGQLSCSSIAYWCSPTALPIVREVVNEYKIRVDASKDKRYKPMYVRNLNEEVPKWETRGWVRRLTGGS
ncbi:hypothetical protein [Pseudonocardia sp. Ae505_Ps2]|uniref:hypothetical protein n=1 Tax=Pseudonocardia sp. Ae505_Ps2 TaxID=1885034 RepID=UPI0014835300|nr:hypothetical protein [Pseudonocardia sp. Ae505_Ps2]